MRGGGEVFCSVYT